MVDDDVYFEAGVGSRDSGGLGEALFVEGKDGGEGFEGSAGSDGVAVEGFGGTDSDVGCVGREDLVDGGGFGGVVGLRAGAVSVDVADLGG